MANITKFESYKTSDGRTFDDYKEAMYHERALMVKNVVKLGLGSEAYYDVNPYRMDALVKFLIETPGALNTALNCEIKII